MTGLILSACCFLNIANAGIITTHGYLTSDADTDFVTDTNSGRLYTRFDAFNLSYADTLTAIGSGGAYDGWSIASSYEADDWYAAAFGLAATPCTGIASFEQECGTLSGWVDGAFGASRYSYVDLFAFINTDGGWQQIGLGEIRDNGEVRDLSKWSDVASLDKYAAINLLLFKESTSVPEPSTLAFFALGMIGLVSRRFKK
jgi:hypothetical protein